MTNITEPAQRAAPEAAWLLLDAGNTALKWAVAGATRAPAAPQRLANDAPQFTGELAAAWSTLDGITRVVGCCVASDAQRAQIDAALRAAGWPAATWWRAEARSGAANGLVSGYRDPVQLGPDRWHAMLGARALEPDQALVVVHAGTATTIDCVTAAGRFDGGVILPGSDLMATSLAGGTARLPRARGAAVPFPDNTDDAIASGIADAQAGAVERVATRFAARQGGAVVVLLAGGAAAALQSQLGAIAAVARVRLADNLVLRGLWQRALSS